MNPLHEKVKSLRYPQWWLDNRPVLCRELAYMADLAQDAAGTAENDLIYWDEEEAADVLAYQAGSTLNFSQGDTTIDQIMDATVSAVFNSYVTDKLEGNH